MHARNPLSPVLLRFAFAVATATLLVCALGWRTIDADVSAHGAIAPGRAAPGLAAEALGSASLPGAAACLNALNTR